MLFGEFPLTQVKGALLAHSLRLSSTTLNKGTCLTSEDIALLAGEGIESLVVAKLERGDVSEDSAAQKLALCFIGKNNIQTTTAFNGRCNLYASKDGILDVDKYSIDQFNNVNEGITIATLADKSLVANRQMVATIKIIPFGISDELLTRAMRKVSAKTLQVCAYKPSNAALIQTTFTDETPRLQIKTEKAIAARAEKFHFRVIHSTNCAHTAESLADCLQRVIQYGETNGIIIHRILIVGISAIVDHGDVIPSAVKLIGGKVEQLGMPMDPGNLLMFAHKELKTESGDTQSSDRKIQILGLPGCARSPLLNGLDMVLAQLAANLNVSNQSIKNMGVGGLLRDAHAPLRKRLIGALPQVSIVILAAGQSNRMLQGDKLMLPISGKPIMTHTIDNAIESLAHEIIVVVSDEKQALEKTIDRINVRIVINDEYKQGVSSSIRVGVEAVDQKCDAILIMLADMPFIDAVIINKIIAAFNEDEQRCICAPATKGRIGNPVLFARKYISELCELQGDKGGRTLIEKYADSFCVVNIDSDSIFTDIDTDSEYLQFSDHPKSDL